MLARTRLACLVGLVVTVATLALVSMWLHHPPAALVEGPPAPPGVADADSRLSLLAVGDTGAFRPLRPFANTQRSVARGMADEDRRDPVQALVLLGDNFYWEGLVREELVPRIRYNLVAPFCRFADLAGPRSGEVADACALAPEERNPVPIFAVLGNHDHKDPESPELQRREVPRFLPNWHVSDGAAASVELGHGVSLILVDSGQRAGGDRAGALREALARAAGPWRIVALHVPLAVRPGEPPSATRTALRAALDAAPDPPQLVLSGHRHNLQLIGLELPRPALQVISGAGSKPRGLREPPFRGRHFGVASAGFARVDLVRAGASEGLRVSLYTVPRSPWVFWSAPRLVSQWWVGRDGAGAQVFPPPKTAASKPSSSSTR